MLCLMLAELGTQKKLTGLDKIPPQLQTGLEESEL